MLNKIRISCHNYDIIKTNIIFATQNLENMATTELKRKAARNKSRAHLRKDTIKRLASKPVIKKVTPEELKAQFAAK